MKRIFTKVFAVGLLAAAVASARADVVTQYTAGTLVFPNTLYYGESFKTPTDFLYYNISFNFYSNAPATTPSAAGTAFLLSQPYSGTPAALSATTPGILAQSTGTTGGVYDFNPNLVLLTNTFYYLYSNSMLAETGGNTTLPTLLYSSTGANTPFVSALSQTGNFSVNGTRVGVPLPEPSSQTAVYLLSGIVGLGFVVMRRRRTLA